MTDTTHNLTPKQVKTIAALLSEATIADAAKKVQIGDRTIYTWLKEPAFNEAYRAARQEAVTQAIAQLQRHSSDAVLVLVDVMQDRLKPASVRVAAARTVLEFAVKAVEVEDLAVRIEALEQGYGSPKPEETT